MISLKYQASYKKNNNPHRNTPAHCFVYVFLSYPLIHVDSCLLCTEIKQNCPNLQECNQNFLKKKTCTKTLPPWPFPPPPSWFLVNFMFSIFPWSPFWLCELHPTRRCPFLLSLIPISPSFRGLPLSYPKLCLATGFPLSPISSLTSTPKNALKLNGETAIMEHAWPCLLTG